jgi:hypothetical protein
VRYGVWKLRHHTFRIQKNIDHKNSSVRTSRIYTKNGHIFSFFLEKCDKKCIYTRSSYGWVLMINIFLYSKSMVSKLSNAVSHVFLWPLVRFLRYYIPNLPFLHNSLLEILSLTGWIGQQLLTKKSTHVDQNFKSDKAWSQLSVDIFIAPGDHLGAQKSLFYQKKSKKPTDPGRPPPGQFLPWYIYIYIYIYTGAQARTGPLAPFALISFTKLVFYKKDWKSIILIWFLRNWLIQVQSVCNISFVSLYFREIRMQFCWERHRTRF